MIDDYNAIENLNDLKNQSLYVGIQNDSFTSPKNLISSKMVTDLINKAELRFAAAQPLFRSLDEMKASAESLKKTINDPKKNDELNERASAEFGINLMPE